MLWIWWLVAAFFGQSSGPGAILNSDVNGDGVVDVNDLLLVVAALEALGECTFCTFTTICG